MPASGSFPLKLSEYSCLSVGGTNMRIVMPEWCSQPLCVAIPYLEMSHSRLGQKRTAPKTVRAPIPNNASPVIHTKYRECASSPRHACVSLLLERRSMDRFVVTNANRQLPL